MAFERGVIPDHSSLVALALAITCHHAGRAEEAISWLQKADSLIRHPDHLHVHFRFEFAVYLAEANLLIQPPGSGTKKTMSDYMLQPPKTNVEPIRCLSGFQFEQSGLGMDTDD